MNFIEKLVAVIVVLVACFALGGIAGYSYGNAQTAKQDVTVGIKATDATNKIEQQNAIAAEPIIKTVVQTVVRTQTIVKEVPVVQTIRVPAPTQDCPAALTGPDRVLIDAAALNVDPATGSGADASPVPAQDVTSSVVQNYGACNTYIAQLKGLQDYVQRTLGNQKLLCGR